MKVTDYLTPVALNNKTRTEIREKKETMKTLPQEHSVAPYHDKDAEAKRLGVSPRTLDIWMRQGRVPFIKIGRTVRFSPGDVDAHLLKNCRVLR